MTTHEEIKINGQLILDYVRISTPEVGSGGMLVALLAHVIIHAKLLPIRRNHSQYTS